MILGIIEFFKQFSRPVDAKNSLQVENGRGNFWDNDFFHFSR